MASASDRLSRWVMSWTYALTCAAGLPRRPFRPVYLLTMGGGYLLQLRHVHVDRKWRPNSHFIMDCIQTTPTAVFVRQITAMLNNSAELLLQELTLAEDGFEAVHGV